MAAKENIHKTTPISVRPTQAMILSNMNMSTFKSYKALTPNMIITTPQI